MFKKPLNDIKTLAPLRTSDRRKLRQRVEQEYHLPDASEDGDLLVPEGLQSVKFVAHAGDPGVAYVSSDGDPLWFTLGKGNTDLIPTVYTLWKRPSLLASLSTPAPVIPILIGGADLMIPGVVQQSDGLRAHQLVSVTQYAHDARGPPLAVGRMALDGSQMLDGMKGKAVHVLHTFKDCLWKMGSAFEPPDPVPVGADEPGEGEHSGLKNDEAGDIEAGDTQSAAGLEKAGESATPPPPSVREDPSDEKGDEAASSAPSPTPQEVSTILRTSLIQAIRTTLADLPPASFPMAATTCYTAHILPARPAFPIDSPSTPVDIKHSAHKTLTAFLKSAEKEDLLRLKEVKGKGGKGGDTQVLGVFKAHPDVVAHAPYRTVGQVEAKRDKQQEKAQEEAKRVKEIVVTELWRPHQQSIRLFEEAGKDSSALYTLPEIKAIFNAYIAAKSLTNAHQQQFINIDDLLDSILSNKSDGPLEFLKKDDALRKLLDKMQPWHRVEAEGKDPVQKKGALKPISVITKVRQGRKACTLITNFEAFFLEADSLADELRRLCASSTAVTPLPGKNAGLEVMVQGKQMKTVADMLMAKGITKKWIESADQTGGKK